MSPAIPTRRPGARPRAPISSTPVSRSRQAEGQRPLRGKERRLQLALKLVRRTAKRNVNRDPTRDYWIERYARDIAEKSGRYSSVNEGYRVARERLQQFESRELIKRRAMDKELDRAHIMAEHRRAKVRDLVDRIIRLTTQARLDENSASRAERSSSIGNFARMAESSWKAAFKLQDDLQKELGNYSAEAFIRNFNKDVREKNE